jgi:hypothetical protein
MHITDKFEPQACLLKTNGARPAMRIAVGVIAFVLLAAPGYAQTNQDGQRMQGQISFGFDGQDYNAGQTSRVGSIAATVRLSPSLTLQAVATGGNYFGDGFAGGGAYVTMHPDAKTFLTVGGNRNSDTHTTVAWSGLLGAGRAVYQSPRGAIRGLEVDCNLTGRGYDLSPSTRILLLDPDVVVYFPRDWLLTLRAGAIRTTAGGATLWTPSGGAKLSVPLTRRLSISPAVAFDSELSDVLQIKNTSSRQCGVSSRFWLTSRTTVDAYYFRVLYGTNHLASSVYGVSYAVRF